MEGVYLIVANIKHLSGVIEDAVTQVWTGTYALNITDQRDL